MNRRHFLGALLKGVIVAPAAVKAIAMAAPGHVVEAAYLSQHKALLQGELGTFSGFIWFTRNNFYELTGVEPRLLSQRPNPYKDGALPFVLMRQDYGGDLLRPDVSLLDAEETC